MAIAIQTTSIGETNGASLVITKPTGVVDGDLMIAVVGAIGAVTSAPSGWTLVTSETTTNKLYIYRKAASSEGTDYTWGFDNDGADGVIMRIDGHNSASPIGTTGTFNSQTNNANPTFTTGITPSVGDSLILMLGVYDGGGGGSVATFSIVTSNPSWTARINTQMADGKGLFCASAVRPQATATGNFSVTSDLSASTDWFGALISLPPNPDVTVSPSVITASTSLFSPTVTGTALVTPAVVTVTANIQAPTPSTPTPDWSNQSKSSTSWTNQNQSWPLNNYKLK